MADEDTSKNTEDYRLGALEAEFWSVKDPEYARKVLRRFPFISRMVMPSRLYHYTDANALIGIVQDRGFRLSHYAYMNDAAELTHGLDIARETLESILGKPAFAGFSEILNEVIRDLGNEASESQYIACFTHEKDSLEQWRAYCPCGGINIEISAPYGGQLGVGPRTLFNEVLYDDKLKKAAIFLIVSRYFRQFRRDITYYGSSEFISAEMYPELMGREITYMTQKFKHSAFQSEREIRLMISGAEERVFERVHSRFAGGKIIPFLLTNDWNEGRPSGVERVKRVEKLNITSIIVGPQQDKELVGRSIKDFMVRSGYPNIKIEYSKAPYRPA